MVTVTALERDAKEYPPVEGGHVWQRTDRLVDYIDQFGYCAGPRCVRCGDQFCEHCNPEKVTEPCTKYGTELPGMDGY